MRKIVCIALLFSFSQSLHAQAELEIREENQPGDFSLVAAGKAAPIIVDAREALPVKTAAELLQKDMENVGGSKPLLLQTAINESNIVIVGTLSHSAALEALIKNNKLDTTGLNNRWEAYRIAVIKEPFTGVKQALVIAGADARGAAFGMMELSKQIGVSPWYWWADVPVKKNKNIFLSGKTFLSETPSVKYRGLFINDEAPALANWTHEKFGGFNHRLYEKVFELMLRLKANYIWPAMWGNAFYDDDLENIKTAERFGIVIGTSHHEPLMRAHDEWRRYGKGAWNYDSNATQLQQFWKQGMQRATNEKIVTVGMRGDGDEPMTEGTAIELLERIVADQRKIIEDVTGKPAAETPQLWALYKEVQNYYDKGMQVPDDVTLLYSDDNWGNIRRLPPLNAPQRKGGYGIYYHFDYVGGPRNYKWLNTNNPARIREQMHLAKAYGADRIWIANVGDIKPMELPLSFFLEYAWDTEKWNEDNLRGYYTAWAAQQFGKSHAKEIGDLLRRYGQYSARRKPELLDASTYRVSPFADDEWSRVVKEWTILNSDAEKVSAQIPEACKDAFYQLVLHPIKAMTNLHLMYEAIARNRYYAEKDNPLANGFADRAKHYYEQDSLITVEYHTMNGGKWNHMMDQTHIGYTYWQQPEVNKMPEVKYVENGEDIPLNEVVTRSAKDAIPAGTFSPTFYEQDGVVSIEAEHWTYKNDWQHIVWKVIPDIGRAGSGITTFPVTASPPADGGPEVVYEFYTYSHAALQVHTMFSPTLNFHNLPQGMQFSIAIDDEAPQVIPLNAKDHDESTWEKWVANNIIETISKHKQLVPGKHSLRIRPLAAGMVLQNIVIDFGGLELSYLGPEETLYNEAR
ncbi:MAG: glycosyl hydrolase 115 family protein [Flavisolibacter sp.]